MYAANYVIDAVQNSKLNLFNKFVADKDLQKLAEDRIKAESNFAKSMVNTSLDLAQYSAEKMINLFFQKNQGADAPKK